MGDYRERLAEINRFVKENGLDNLTTNRPDGRMRSAFQHPPVEREELSLSSRKEATTPPPTPMSLTEAQDIVAMMGLPMQNAPVSGDIPGPHFPRVQKEPQKG